MKKLFAAILVLAALAVSCSKDPVPEPVVPDGYAELYEAYTLKWTCLGAVLENNRFILTFEEGQVTLQPTQVKIDDCSGEYGPRIVAWNADGEWMVGGVSTGVSKNTGLSNADAVPVYVYFTSEKVCVYLSNANQLMFTIYIPEPEHFTMPVVRIRHSADRVHKSYYVDCTISIEDPDAHYSENTSLSAPAQIRGRGNSTWGMPKQPYRIKFTEEQKVLGMPKNRDWCLLANYADKSLLRNAVAMRLSEIVGMPWTPRRRSVEVYLNNKYVGVYDLFEAKEVTKNKVNIDIDAGDLYLEIEQTTDEPYYFSTTKCGVPVQFKDPEEPAQEVYDATVKYFEDFEAALFSDDFTDPTEGYAAWIDVDSFVDNYIVEELSKDIDGNVRKSSFLTLCVGDRLRFYHEWDFDLAFGNADYFPSGNNGPTGWWIKNYTTASWTGEYGWYQRLFKDPAFVKKVVQKWDYVYSELQTVPDYIDLLVFEMDEAPARNFKTWNILNTYVWPNVKIPGSYEGEIDYLKDFYSQRLEWLNTNLHSLK